MQHANQRRSWREDAGRGREQVDTIDMRSGAVETCTGSAWRHSGKSRFVTVYQMNNRLPALWVRNPSFTGVTGSFTGMTRFIADITGVVAGLMRQVIMSDALSASAVEPAVRSHIGLLNLFT